MNKPARALRTASTPKAATEGKARKPRAPGGDFNADLRALAEKHRKKSNKLRATVGKLESKLEVARRQLDAADGPLRKVERVLADNPELPGFAGADVGAPDGEVSGRVPDLAAPSLSSTLPAHS
jgi:hypothetical protein